MAIQASRLNDDKYLHWLRTSLSLLYLKEGLCPFCDEKSTEFHKDIRENVQLKNTFAVTSICSTCTCRDVKKRKQHGVLTWQIHCGSNICNEWLDEILRSHVDYPCPDIAWTNSDPQLWTTDVWELAKLYQPHGCVSHKSAADSDCQGLLRLLRTCTHFHPFLSNRAVIEQINDVRNACMHSSSMLIEDGEMRRGLNLIISLLDQPHLKHRTSCVEAKTKISQLRDNLLDISLNKELELQALNHKISAVRSDVDRLEAELQQLQTSLSDVTTRQDTTAEEYRQMCERVRELGRNITEIRTSQEQLTQTIDPSVGIKMADLTSRLQELEKTSNTEIAKLQLTIAGIETRLGNLETQRIRTSKEQSTQTIDPSVGIKMADLTSGPQKLEKTSNTEIVKLQLTIAGIETRLGNLETQRVAQQTDQPIDIKVQVKMVDKMPAGNVAVGLVYNYFVDYLRIILPELAKASQESEYYDDRRMFKKFLLLVPDSGKIARLECDSGDYIIKKMEKNLVIQKAHGVEMRSYNPSVYSISYKGSEPYYFIGECPFILETMSKIHEGNFFTIDMKFHLNRFCMTMQYLMKHRGCHNNIHLIHYEDTGTPPVEDIWNTLDCELKPSSCEVMTKSQAGKKYSEDGEESPEYFVTVTTIERPKDHETANNIIKCLEEKKVKFTSGRGKFKSMMLDQARSNVFVVSAEAVKKPHFQRLYEDAVERSVTYNKVNLLIVLTKGTDLEELPLNYTWMTLLKEDDPNYLIKLWVFLNRDEDPGTPPVEDIWNTLDCELKPSSCEVMTKSQAGKIYSEDGEESPEYFVTVRFIERPKDHETANNIIKYLEEKKVKFTSGHGKFESMMLYQARYNVFVVSAEAVNKTHFQRLYEDAVKRSVNYNKVKLLIVLTKGTDLEELPLNYTWMTLLKEDDPDYLIKLWVFLNRDEDTGTPPVEDIWNTLDCELKPSSCEVMTKSQAGKNYSEDGEESPEYFVTVTTIERPKDHETANNIIKCLEEKKVKFTSGHGKFESMMLYLARSNVFVVSAEAVNKTHFQRLYEDAVKRSVNYNKVNLLIVLLTKGTDLKKLPVNYTWMTLLKEDDPDYLIKLWVFLNREKKEMTQSIPPGNVYVGLSFAYLLNYLVLAVTGNTADGRGFRQRFEDAMKKYSCVCPCVARVFIIVPKSCTFPAPGSQFPNEEHLGEIEPVVMGFRKYFLQMYRLTLSDGQKVCYAREYAEPGRTLHEMANTLLFSGLTKAAMNEQAERFADLVMAIIHDANFKQQEQNLEDKVTMVYVDDEPDNAAGVTKALEEKLTQSLANRDCIDWE